VAVAKWGRVTLLSPRASMHGFSWRDTLAHELTHLAVTRATADRAPLWLQEGVAKREEIRWRAPGPFDERPPVDSIVLKGIELKLDLALDKLGPSIAMLPSADAAMVAFAEVTSFVRFYASVGGEDALPLLFQELKSKKKIDEALGGLTLAQWDAKWRAYLAGRPRESLSMLFGLGADPKSAMELRERVRLAELLMGQSHPAAAMSELDKAPRLGLEDPSTRYVRARTLEALSRTADASAEVASPKMVQASYGPWWAIRGRLFRGSGDTAQSTEAFWEGLGADPYDVEVACQSLDPGGLVGVGQNKETPADPPMAALCGAARALGAPALGRD
jgi:hypothetical protein